MSKSPYRETLINVNQSISYTSILHDGLCCSECSLFPTVLSWWSFCAPWREAPDCWLHPALHAKLLESPHALLSYERSPTANAKVYLHSACFSSTPASPFYVTRAAKPLSQAKQATLTLDRRLHRPSVGYSIGPVGNWLGLNRVGNPVMYPRVVPGYNRVKP